MQAKSRETRIKGMEPKFSCSSDIQAFEKKLMKCFVAHGLDRSDKGRLSNLQSRIVQHEGGRGNREQSEGGHDEGDVPSRDRGDDRWNLLDNEFNIFDRRDISTGIFSPSDRCKAGSILVQRGIRPKGSQ